MYGGLDSSGENGRVSADILKTIDDTLEWYGSEDSAQWTPPGAFPVLAEHQAETARQLSADTGMDGYAAWLMVADVLQQGSESPFLHPVLNAGRKVFPSAAGYRSHFGGVGAELAADAGWPVSFYWAADPAWSMENAWTAVVAARTEDGPIYIGTLSRPVPPGPPYVHTFGAPEPISEDEDGEPVYPPYVPFTVRLATDGRTERVSGEVETTCYGCGRPSAPGSLGHRFTADLVTGDVTWSCAGAEPEPDPPPRRRRLPRPPARNYSSGSLPYRITSGGGDRRP